MRKEIQASCGYIKRTGNRSEPAKLKLEVQRQTHHGEDGTLSFKERAPDFLVEPEFYAGVAVRITKEEGASSLETLEEHSVTLTLSQVKTLIAYLHEEAEQIQTLLDATKRP